MTEEHYEGLKNDYSSGQKPKKPNQTTKKIEIEKDSKGLLSPKGSTINNL